MANIIDASPLVWYNEYQVRYNDSNKLTTLYQDPLVGNSFVSNGSYGTFSYLVQAASNGNTKTINIAFNDISLVSFNLTDTNPVLITGTITATNMHLGTATVVGQYFSNSFAPILFTKNLTGLNFYENIKLILQGQATAYKDITSIEGKGLVWPNPSF